MKKKKLILLKKKNMELTSLISNPRNLKSKATVALIGDYRDERPKESKEQFSTRKKELHRLSSIQPKL